VLIAGFSFGSDGVQFRNGLNQAHPGPSTLGSDGEGNKLLFPLTG
jgi:hypothetical protein